MIGIEAEAANAGEVAATSLLTASLTPEILAEAGRSVLVVENEILFLIGDEEAYD